jgi:hypothetical protein
MLVTITTVAPGAAGVGGATIVMHPVAMSNNPSAPTIKCGKYFWLGTVSLLVQFELRRRAGAARLPTRVISKLLPGV